jgi:hypothetical protein
MFHQAAQMNYMQAAACLLPPMSQGVQETLLRPACTCLARQMPCMLPHGNKAHKRQARGPSTRSSATQTLHVLGSYVELFSKLLQPSKRVVWLHLCL